MREMSKIKGAIAFGVLMLLIFGAQSYVLYFKYIPNVLAPYAGDPAIYEHFRKALYSMAGDIRGWFLTLEGCITGLIIGFYLAAKKNKKVSHD